MRSALFSAFGERQVSTIYLPTDSYQVIMEVAACLLYTSDAADERSSVDLGGRRIIQKKKNVGVSVVAHVYKKYGN